MKTKMFTLLISVIMIITAITMVSVSAKVSHPYITDGLVACYQGNDNTGSGQDTKAKTWADLSGNGNDIKKVVINSTNYFTEDAYVLNTSKTFFPDAIKDTINGNEFTVELVLGKMDSIATEFNTFLNCTNDNFSLFRRVPGDFIEFKCAANQRPKVPGGLNYFRKSTVTITYKVGGMVKMYVNGKKIDEKSITTAINADDFWFGHDQTSRNYEAEFLSMRFYSKELTADQVSANYKADLEIFYDTAEESQSQEDSSADERDPIDEDSSQEESTEESETTVSTDTEDETKPDIDASEDKESDDPDNKKDQDYTIYIIIGGVLIVALIVGIIISVKKKKS